LCYGCTSLSKQAMRLLCALGDKKTPVLPIRTGACIVGL
jgi:hypothetical protein